MKYKSCDSLENNWMVFNGAFDRGLNTLGFCCGDNARKISVELSQDPEETWKRYQEMKNKIINESIQTAKTGKPSKNEFYHACYSCSSFHENTDWPQGAEVQIAYIDIGAGPSPCNAKCFYCSSMLEDRRKYDAQSDAPHNELIFKHIQYYKDKGLFAKNIYWGVGAGEITVHPFREKIYKIIGTSQATWMSNCYLYSEEIAENLEANPKSTILTSLDAGSPKTWNKIKGADNFIQVKENIKNYAKNAQTKGNQISLKYIILPGINDDMKNTNNFIQFAAEIGAKCITLAMDRGKPFTDAHLKAATLLSSFAVKNKMEVECIFIPDEFRKQIAENALLINLH